MAGQTEGLGFMREAVRLAPARADYWFELALRSLQLGLSREAAQGFERVLQCDRADALAWFGLGRALLAAQEPRKASDAFAEGLRREPGDRQLRLALPPSVQAWATSRRPES